MTERGPSLQPAALRYELLRAPYRLNYNFTRKGLLDADKAVSRLRTFGSAGSPPSPNSAMAFSSPSYVHRGMKTI